ncbi:hypothetical protein C6P46_005293 [Rhodotorula mucilaginosa]|uniref:Uncharacterized protein n=1 Tax=Rhodotorula mucilaginosa TaxID=5537 RepID=A0A9P6W0U5_RHOMI|nr:hypothetical protein C6P46_005293 [Rhodotorula mucilaginosa]
MAKRLTSPYDRSVDYAELAGSVASLSPFLAVTASGRSTLDFQDEAAVRSSRRALNGALLKRDFDLDVETPSDRLCPSVRRPMKVDSKSFPHRFPRAGSTTCFIVSNSFDKHGARERSEPFPKSKQDSMCASAIYPLLAVRYAASRAPQDFANLRMLATDINEKSLAIAKSNAERNGLAEAISVHRVEPDGPIFPPAVVDSASHHVASIEFTMCNPPFYGSAEEIASLEAGKASLPFAICTGADNEMVTPGGEVAFVSRMIRETRTLGRSRIKWFTSLLGKYSSIAPLIDELKSCKILNYHVSALPMRGHTTRWVLSWSIQDWRVPPFLIKDTIAREGVSPTTAGPSFPLKRFLSPATAPLVFVPTTGPRRTADDNAVRDRVTDALRNALHELVQVGEQAAEGRDFEWSDEPTGGGSGGGGVAQPDRTFRVTASRNVWSRKARRVAALADAAAPKPELSQEQVEQAPASGVTKDPPPPQQSPMLDLRIEIWTTTARETESSEARDGPASSASSSIRLEGWWIRGLDQERSALEGLWGFLTRRIGDAVREQEVGAEGVEGKGEAGGGGGEMEGGGGGAVGSRRKRRKL